MEQTEHSSEPLLIQATASNSFRGRQRSDETTSCNMLTLPMPTKADLLRILVVIASVIGIAAHVSSIVTYMYCRCNPVGMDFKSPSVKIALTYVMSYKQINRYEAVMKIVAEGGGVLAYICLLVAAVRRSMAAVILFLTLAILYLTGIAGHLYILFRMWRMGFKMVDLNDEIGTAVLTFTYEYFAVLLALALLIHIWRKAKLREFETVMEATGTYNEIPV